ncbi:MAG: ABC transporter ATP-binding protein [Candidatus Moraniibacteriota bacterium]|nr:MAG: ABC transporter ATP-binding protein [Candidatus Moranbacteria bacterium]
MLNAENIIKTFITGEIEQKVLKGINLKVESGEFVSIMGRSGAGKSTLLYILSLLDETPSGKVFIDNEEITLLSSDKAVNYRLNNFGFVFQEYALLPELNALENVALPLLMRGERKNKAYTIAKESLIQVGLENKAENFSSQLSGGEQQRVSIARAVAHNPKIIFADEPTANLDTQRACEIMNIFIDLNKKGQTIIMVTHELEYAQSTHRIVELRDGLIVNDRRMLDPKTLLCRL